MISGTIAEWITLVFEVITCILVAIITFYEAASYNKDKEKETKTPNYFVIPPGYGDLR